MTDLFPIDEIDAMTIAVVACESFVSLPFSDMNQEQAQGALLLFEGIMNRVEPKLPKNDKTEFLTTMISKARATADRTRAVYGLPPRV